ncbi:nucleic acid binding protein, putative [Babesia ovis]|uniref:Nucleic acid binding protein, putative n=1 Tax=Babesia ovis TaxID=5869 RepID=A0A9W5TDN1_BABOV|nr:nucleic acid binding protein, putative [Babesia ovis]
MSRDKPAVTGHNAESPGDAEQDIGLIRLPAICTMLPTVIDLEAFVFPPTVELYEGRFSNEGIYRMICSPAGTIRVMYGEDEIVPRCLESFPHDDVYVEYFVREHERVIRVFAFKGPITRPVRFHIRTFLVDCVGPVECSGHVVTWITDGPISLDLNITPGVPLHPFVVRKNMMEGTRFGFIYTVVREHRGYEVNEHSCYLRNPYMIGWIYYMMDHDQCGPYDGKPLLAEAHLVKVIFNSDQIEVRIVRPGYINTHIIRPIRRRYY